MFDVIIRNLQHGEQGGGTVIDVTIWGPALHSRLISPALQSFGSRLELGDFVQAWRIVEQALQGSDIGLGQMAAGSASSKRYCSVVQALPTVSCIKL